MQCAYFLKGNCKFGDKCFNLHHVKKEKNSEKIYKKDVLTEVDGAKKKPMKTAINVINRILWDTSLPSENFIVGYLDRFTGIKEKKYIASGNC